MFNKEKIFSSTKNILFPLAGISWVLFVFGSWVFHNNKFEFIGKIIKPLDSPMNWPNSFIFPQMSPLIFVILIYWFLLFWFVYVKKIKELEFEISPFSLIFWQFVLTAVMLFVAAYIRSNIVLGGQAVLDFGNFFSEFPKMLFLLVVAYLGVIFPILFSFSVGSMILRKFEKRVLFSDGLLSVLVKICLGFFALIALFFMLGVFGKLSIIILWISFLFISLFTYEEYVRIFKWIFKKGNHSIELKSTSAFFFVFIPLFFSADIIDLLKPIPNDFDSLSYYFNRVRLIFESGQILNYSGGYPFPYELLASANSVMFRSLTGGFMYGMVSLILSTAVIFGLVRYFSSKKNNQKLILVPAFWLSMNIIYGLSVYQSKPDTMAFSLAGVGFWLFFSWIRDRKNVAYLYLSFLIMGMAASFKLTFLIFFAAVLLGAIFSWSGWKIPVKIKLKNIIIAFIFFLLPFLPWFGFYLKNDQIKPNSGSSDFRSMLTDKVKYPFQFYISAEKWESVGINHNDCVKSATGLKEDLDRYHDSGKNNFAGFLMFPWDFTMNLRMGSFITEVSPIILAFCLLALAWSLKNKEKNISNFSGLEIRIISVMGVIYWIGWYVLCNGVIWYGIAGFIFLLLPMLIFVTADVDKWIKWLFYIIFGLSLIFVLGMRARYFASWMDIKMLAGNISYYEYINNVSSGMPKFIQLMKENPEKKVWSTGTTAVYYLENPSKQLYLDQYLDYFNCIYKEKNDDLTLARLKKLGIDYIYVASTLRIMSPAETLQNKINTFNDFASRKLKLEDSTASYSLYGIPKE